MAKINGVNSLSDREYEILRLMLKGISSSDISLKLGISRHTVDTHRRHILKKLGYPTTVQLIAKFSK